MVFFRRCLLTFSRVGATRLMMGHERKADDGQADCNLNHGEVPRAYSGLAIAGCPIAKGNAVLCRFFREIGTRPRGTRQLFRGVFISPVARSTRRRGPVRQSIWITLWPAEADCWSVVLGHPADLNCGFFSCGFEKKRKRNSGK